MKSLETVQKALGVFRTIVKIAKILCIVGASLCAVAALCAVVWQNGGRVYGLMGEPIEAFAGKAFPDMYAALLTHTLALVADAVLLGMAQGYLKHEQADGTPFTEKGAEKLKRLGIRCIYVPLIVAVVSGVIVVLLGAKNVGGAGNLPGLAIGIGLILFSRVFRYGADLEKRVSDSESNSCRMRDI